MMRMRKKTLRMKAAASLCAAGILFQFGGCNIGQIPVATTLDGSELLITLIRGAILSPIDTAITNAVRNLFDREDD
jgi:hypothetical protein